MTTGAAPLPFSAVAATTQAWPEVRPLLESLQDQIAAIGGEIVLGDGSAAGIPPDVRTRHPRLRVLHRPGASVFQLRAACVAALFGLPWLFWPDWRMGAAACVALVLVRAWAARYFVKRIGGYTGDCLGFTQQLCELAIYLVVLGWTSS